MNRDKFLPVSKQDLTDRGISKLDFVLVSGDAYVDHPSFGTAVIGRVLENSGYTVGIIAQPDFNSTKDIMRFGKPKYGFMVSSGNVDSMVNHYTSAKRKRNDDYYSPGGKSGKRPDRAVTVYCKLIRDAYGDVPIILGGLEASLRRFAHYDYWADAVMPSILIDSKADMITYGMSEKQVLEIAKYLADGKNISEITDVRGTCYTVQSKEIPIGILNCPTYETVCTNKKEYAKSCRIQYDEHDHIYGRTLLQKHGKVAVIQNPPMPPLSTEEMDSLAELPYARYYHPDYEKDGGIPAIEEVEFSVIHNRGCFGHCNFCAIAYHQGRYMSARSEKSVLKEAENFTKNPRFKGYIHDVGGPTANFREPSCEKQSTHGMCRGKKCLAPKPCPALKVSHSDYLSILRKMREIKGVKKVFVRSGLRYDYMLEDKDDSFFKELVAYHVSGQLKVAPEHCTANVLDSMGKPHIEVYEKFQEKFYRYTKSIGKEQYLVPYLMSSHPGSTINDAVDLAVFLKKNNIRPEQVQDFYPTPGSLSTCMFYTGLDPYTLEPVYVPKSSYEKKLQRVLLQYYKAENSDLIIKALQSAKRTDLIGNGQNCLVSGNRQFGYNKTQHHREDYKKWQTTKKNKPKNRKSKGKANR